MPTTYYPPYLMFAGEKFKLAPAEWKEFWARCFRLIPRNHLTVHETTRDFLREKGLIYGDHEPI